MNPGKKFPFILRKDQLEALSLLCRHNHLIYIAATGSGKSVVFQKYIFDRPGIRVLFISPLNALSRQQTERFEQLGVSGVWIMSPEKLQASTLEKILEWQPQFLIVDEAHCVWEWGREFRPDYRKILELLKLPSLQKSIWCSATFPASFRRELKVHFRELKNQTYAELGEFRFSPNIKLSLEKIPTEKKLVWLQNKLALHQSQNGVIFCNTRASAEKLQHYLSLLGVRAFYYHAGLSIEEKLVHEKNLKMHTDQNEPIVIIATSAFGMGMDYAFFRFCILFEPSFTLLSLVQAIGRVGRGSHLTQAYVIWCENDFARHQGWVDQTEVYQWCQSLGNPVKYLEKHFNEQSFSGTLK